MTENFHAFSKAGRQTTFMAVELLIQYIFSNTTVDGPFEQEHSF